MDLFSQNPDLSVYQACFGKWWDVLDKNVMMDAYDRTLEFSKGGTICPDFENVFRAYSCSDPNAIKCVILSICPYPDSNADGLAFSSPRPTESLRQIYFAITKDTSVFDKKLTFNYCTDLHYWCIQGVMLLNTKLAVYEGDVLSGKGLHEKLIQETCQYLEKNGCSFLAIGSPAISLFKRTLSSKDYYSSSHPVEASRSGIAWQCPHFENINNDLLSQNKGPIMWTRLCQ